MGRYPAEPFEDKLVWMRARQRKRQAAEARIEPGRALPPDPPLLLQPPQFFRVNQVAKALNVSVKTVQRWFRRHAIIVQGPHKATMLIPARALDDWIREHGPSSR